MQTAPAQVDYKTPFLSKKIIFVSAWIRVLEHHCKLRSNMASVYVYLQSRSDRRRSWVRDLAWWGGWIWDWWPHSEPKCRLPSPAHSSGHVSLPSTPPLDTWHTNTKIPNRGMNRKLNSSFFYPSHLQIGLPQSPSNMTRSLNCSNVCCRQSFDLQCFNQKFCSVNISIGRCSLNLQLNYIH